MNFLRCEYKKNKKWTVPKTEQEKDDAYSYVLFHLKKISFGNNLLFQ
jgi:hypothetical protein